MRVGTGGARRRLGRIVSMLLGTMLALAAAASPAAADSDIRSQLAFVAAPGQGHSLEGIAVTNNGPDPAAGVTVTGSVPTVDDDGNGIVWHLFVGAGTVTNAFQPTASGVELSGPPYSKGACRFTSPSDYQCDVGPLAVGETRVVVMFPTWTEPNTAVNYTLLQPFPFTVTLVGGADPDPANNEFSPFGFYYGPVFTGEQRLEVVELSPPASGAYAPGDTVRLQISSTVPLDGYNGAVSVVVPDPDAVTCSGDGVCLTGGPHAMTGPANRVLISMAAAPMQGFPVPELTGLDQVFTTVLSARLPSTPLPGCTPGGTVPFTFDAIQQPVIGGSGLIWAPTITVPTTVQVSCDVPVRAPPVRGPSAGSSSEEPPVGGGPARRAVVRPRLRVSKVASARRIRAGRSVTYRVRVTNPSRRALRSVRVCDQLPAGMVYGSSRARATLRNGRYCWEIRRLGPKQSRAFRITLRALAGTRGRTVNRVVATSPDARSGRAQAIVVVTGAQVRAGGVTG